MSGETPDRPNGAVDLEVLFDRSAPEPSEAQLTRMAARATEAVGPHPAGGMHPFLLGLLAAGCTAVVLLGLGSLQDPQELLRQAVPAVGAATDSPTAEAAAEAAADDLDLLYDMTFDIGWGLDGEAGLDLADGPFGDLSEEEITALYDHVLTAGQGG